MRILFLSNFYPPASLGGYEQWCQEVAEGLQRRGHEIVVLTSRHGRERLPSAEPRWIRRELHVEMELASLRNGLQFFTNRIARERENLLCVQKLVADFAPDALFLWGMWNLSRSIPALAEELGGNKVVYYIGDIWPSLPSQYKLYWEAPARNWATAVPKNLLQPFAYWLLGRKSLPRLQFRHALLPSAFMLEELQRRNVVLQKATIVPGAIDTSLYRARRQPDPTQEHRDLALLWLGRLTPEKGAHTAIEALGLLQQQGFPHKLTLTIVGAGDPDYEQDLRELAQRLNVAPLIRFMGAQPKARIPDFYNQADVFLFTSSLPESFGRVLVEAMAAGVVVVGTTAGGAAEILTENENALKFPPGDVAALATQIARLADSPALRQRLTEAGQQTALQKFDIQRMVADIETYLVGLVNQPSALTALEKRA